MILVAGGTGHLGRELVPLLLNRSHHVRVLTRDSVRARQLLESDVELAVGDVRQAYSLAGALRNVDAVVSAVTGFGPGGAGPASVDLQGNLNLIRAAESAGVKDFVLLSMHGAAIDHPMELMRMKYKAEIALRGSRLNWTVIRPTVFMELWAGLIGEPIRRKGRTTVFGRGENPINFVSVKDLARFVELAVGDSKLRDRAIDVGGPEDISLNQVVRAFETLVGHRVHARHIPRPAMKLASVALRPFRQDIAGMIGAGLVMDTTDMTFDASSLQQAYPEIELTHLGVVARHLFEMDAPKVEAKAY